MPQDLQSTKTQLDYILIDGSSSMGDKWAPLLASLDTYIKTLAEQQISTHINVMVFENSGSGLVENLIRDESITDWHSFRDYWHDLPGGDTPLYDAIYRMGLRLRDAAPENAAITIVTDGDENGSRFATEDMARGIIEWMKAQGWQVTFMGCDFNNSRQARALGASDANSIGVRKHLLTDAASALAAKRARNVRSGADITFSDDEKEQFGGYLAAPTAK